MLSFLSFLLFHLYISGEAAAESPAYKPTDYFLYNCGASSNQSDDRREWKTDKFSKFIPPNAADISITTTASEQGPSVKQVPYTTGVRIFTSEFTYSFPVSAGLKFLRLYFFPTHYSSGQSKFNKEDFLFSVKANNDHILLSNFSAYLTAAAINDSVIMKEYVVNVDHQMLNITFTPSPKSYAFVNGIEIVSIPTGYYIHGEGGEGNGIDDQIKWVGSKNNIYYLYNYTALETMYRLNIGAGNTLSASDDTGMYRIWYADDGYVIGNGYQTPHLDVLEFDIVIRTHTR